MGFMEKAAALLDTARDGHHKEGHHKEGHAAHGKEHKGSGGKEGDRSKRRSLSDPNHMKVLKSGGQIKMAHNLYMSAIGEDSDNFAGYSRFLTDLDTLLSKYQSGERDVLSSDHDDEKNDDEKWKE